MRTLRNRHEPLDFGKYRGRSITEIKREDPAYLAWLYHENVICFSNKSSQSWFKRHSKRKEPSVSYSQYYAAHVAAGFFEHGYYDRD